MLTWTWIVVVALALVVGAALYIRLRWRRAPQAHRAMMVLAACYFLAGSLVGAWVLHLMEPSPSAPVASASAPAVAPQPANRPTRHSAKVISITDGDTIMVADSAGRQEVIRLAGIDAPEHNQTFGSQSTANLTALVSAKTVNLECGSERSYGRLICKILLPTGEDACLDQVKAGMAWHYKQYQDDQTPTDREAYAAAECAAMKARVGLWSDPHSVQPQDFRHGTTSPLLLDANGCRRSSEPTSGPVVGNSRSHIFEWPGCPSYSDIAPDNRAPFPSPQAAEAAGYRPARNCP